MLENECLFEIVGNIFVGKLEKIDELAYRYHFSESTLRRILSHCKPILENYDLRWGSDPLTIEGNEANLRKFFKDFYYEGADTIYSLVPDLELHELILNQLQGKLGNYEIGSGTTPVAFYYTFYIAIKRACLGYNIFVPKELAKLAYKSKNFSMLYSLKEGIVEIYDIQLRKEEFAWIYLVTVCKRTLNREEQELEFYRQFNQGEEISELTDRFLNDLELPISKYKTIAAFLRSFFLSRKINHLIAPVLNKEMDDIKEVIICSDSENYQRNLLFLYEHRKSLFLHTAYIEDISVSLTIYSELILDNYSSGKNIYFLLEGNHFICQQIKARAIQQLGNKHFLTFIPLQDLTKDTLNAAHIDLIVTNYNRYLDYIWGTHYFLMKAVPDEQDWQHLEKKVNPYHK